MKTFLQVSLILVLSWLPAHADDSTEKAATWTPTEWNGEQAFTAAGQTWRAIVSVERARLVYFGTLEGTGNLLFAPARRDEPAGWGGHRLWLGPQAEWPGGWPPPNAWEASPAQRVTVHGNRLRLELPDAGDGWPSLVRDYVWTGDRLHCNAKLSGGTRPAQVIHILQVPSTAAVRATAQPSQVAPRGYVQVHLGRQPSPQGVFAPPPHVTQAGEALTLQFNDQREKFGFRPQPLVATVGSVRLTVSRGMSNGQVRTIPDDGFVTQAYLGSGDSKLIELEQLSPLWTAGGEASFEMVIEARLTE